MDQVANIDTGGLGYEETAYTTQQPQVAHTSPRSSSPEAQDALSLASTLQQLREQRLAARQGGDQS